MLACLRLCEMRVVSKLAELRLAKLNENLLMLDVTDFVEFVSICCF